MKQEKTSQNAETNSKINFIFGAREIIFCDAIIIDRTVRKSSGGVFFEVDGFLFEVSVFILKSMSWRAAQNP